MGIFSIPLFLQGENRAENITQGLVDFACAALSNEEHRSHSQELELKSYYSSITQTHRVLLTFGLLVLLLSVLFHLSLSFHSGKLTLLSLSLIQVIKINEYKKLPCMYIKG